MSAARRIDGIDLFRGIAAFAVVILHSDEVIKIVPQGWSFFLKFSSFAVPFFLATSFYLLVDKLSNSSQIIKWTDRFSRLLTPYLFWSAVYLGIKVLQSLLKKQPHKIEILLHNWADLIFLGQAGFHLYFIPLLVSGILLVIAAQSFIRSRPNLLLLVFLLVLSIFIYHSYTYLYFSNTNSFVNWLQSLVHINFLDPNNEFLDFFVKFLGFFIRCSSYIAVALVFSRLRIKDKLLNFKTTNFLVCLLIFIAINSFSDFGLPKVVHELLRGYITLALAFASSSYIQNNKIVSSLGRCSFGIYLMHLAFLEVLWSLSNKFRLGFEKPSLAILILVVVFTYLISWYLTHVLMQKKEISKVMFGA